jgi:hypothetical protein
MARILASRRGVAIAMPLWVIKLPHSRYDTRHSIESLCDSRKIQSRGQNWSGLQGGQINCHVLHSVKISGPVTCNEGSLIVDGKWY